VQTSTKGKKNSPFGDRKSEKKSFRLLLKKGQQNVGFLFFSRCGKLKTLFRGYFRERN